MAKSNQVDIEVHLKGAEAAKKGLSSIGDSAGKMAGKFDQTNSHLGEGLSQITDNVSELGGSFKELGSTLGSLGTVGGAGISSLIPAFAGAVAAGMALYETFRMITGAAQQAEDAQEAAAAAAADLQSKLESLAEKGVTPAAAALSEFALATVRSQLAKSKLEKVLEKAKELQDAYTQSLADEAEVKRKVAAIDKEMAELFKKRKEMTKADPRLLDSIEEENDLMRERGNLLNQRDKAERNLRRFIHDKVVPLQQQVNREIAAAATLEKKLDEQSAEATLSRVKELQAKLELLKVAEAEAQHEGNALELQKTYISQEKDALTTRIESVKERAKDLQMIEKELQAQVSKFDEQAVMDARYEAQRREIHSRINSEIDAEDKARFASLQARRKKSLVDNHRIRLLEIEQMKILGASQEEVLEMRYQADLKMARGNAKAKLALDLRYENQRLKLQQEADAKAEAERQKLEAHRRSFLFESQAFDISMMQDGIDKELSALELKYRREREMKERSEEELTELTRRYDLERQAIQQRAVDAQINSFAEVTNTLGAGLTDAAYASLFFGESFKDSAAEVIKGLGQQAAVEALMNTAKGLAAAVLNPAAAGAYFAAAAGFGVAATAAGVASASLGGGGGGGGASAPTSPTGSPQIAPTAEREQAESSQMVFNINFGGAVVYDTKQAAELALADRITSLQNINRRGAPRRRF
jgi:DNA repair exonuclease SbcCD ATPase subunit